MKYSALVLLVRSCLFALAQDEVNNNTASIIGGSNAGNNEFPGHGVTTASNGNICGGSLIWPDFVLTAAHCTVGNTFYIGGLELSGDDAEARSVDGQWVPPGYNPSQNGADVDDLRLVRLSSSSSKTLFEWNDGGNTPAVGHPTVALGFGRTSAPFGPVSSVLKKVDQQVVLPEFCTPSNAGPVRMVCMGARDGDTGSTCAGDSGSPALFNGVIVGVNSFGIRASNGGCLDSGYTGFTRVSNYHDWIRTTICNNSRETPCTCPNPPDDCIDPPKDFSLSLCFSKVATVRVEHQEAPVSMKDLSVGDKVLTSISKKNEQIYEPIYAFGHRHETQLASFLQLITSNNSTPLEMSGEHMVFVHGRTGPVRADSVKIGDALIRISSDTTSSNHSLSSPTFTIVTAIKKIQRKGLYAPLTPSGTIVVDGILASAYAGMLGKNEHVEIGNHNPIPLLQVDAIHTFLSPWRLVCRAVSFKLCGGHDEEGVHNYVVFGMRMLRWGEQQHVLVQVTSLAMVLLVTGVFCAAELLIMYASTYAVLFLFVAAAAWGIVRRNSSKRPVSPCRSLTKVL